MSIWNKLGKAFKKLLKPATLTGHRGTHSEDREYKDIPANEVDAFLHENYPLFVYSSNVVMAQYFEDTSQMMIGFSTNRSYIYDGLSLYEAKTFVTTTSKGKWVWDHLRIRGTAYGHRKPYRSVS